MSEANELSETSCECGNLRDRIEYLERELAIRNAELEEAEATIDYLVDKGTVTEEVII